MQKIDSLTGLRAFAAMLVVVHHFAYSEGVRPLGIGKLVGNWVWGVDIFFVLSGFILAYRYLPSRSTVFDWAAYRFFIVKRFARVYPLHLATFLVFAGIWFAAQRTGHPIGPADVDNTARTALENLLLVHAWGVDDKVSWNFVSWSISAEWFAYLFLIPLCAHLLSRVSRVTCGVVVLVGWLTLCAYCTLYRDGDLALTTSSVLRIAPQFIGGYWLYRVLKTWVITELPMCVALAALLFLMCAPVTYPVLLLPLTLLVIGGLANGGPVGTALFGNRVMVFVGKISFSIYLLHPILRIACDEVVIALHLRPDAATALAILLAELLAVVAFATLGYYLIEMPARRAIVAWAHARLGRLPAHEHEHALPPAAQQAKPTAEGTVTPTASAR